MARKSRAISPVSPAAREADSASRPDSSAQPSASEAAARLTNRAARVIGISLNTSGLAEHEARATIAAATAETGLPCTDPLRFGCAALADAMEQL